MERTDIIKTGYSTEDLGIYYKGGCGGYFILFYVLASGKKYNITRQGIQMNHDEDHLDALFYANFIKRKSNNFKFWKSTEQVPDQYYIKSPYSKLYFKCNATSEYEKSLRCFKINPYINDTHKWFLIQWKKGALSADLFYAKKQLSLKKKIYKHTENLQNGRSKINFCDYSFDFLDFLKYKESREKLCNTLGIKENKKQQEYLNYYLDCHDSKMQNILLT